MTLSKLQNKLEIKGIPEAWSEALELAVRNFDEDKKRLFDVKRVTEILDKHNVLRAYRKDITEACAEIVLHSEAVLYIALIYEALKLGLVHEGEVSAIKGDAAWCRFALIFPLLENLPQNVEYLKRRGISDRSIEGTLYEFDRMLEVYGARTGGRRALNSGSFDWLQLIYENRLIRIGRLNFEMRYDFIGKVKVFRSKTGEVKILSHGSRIHKSGRPLGAALCLDEDGLFEANVTETEDEYIGYPTEGSGAFSKELAVLPKSEWTLALEYGDKIIAVHIPSGSPLDPEECEKSYELARATFKKCFPEFEYKAFSCISWLMDRQLESLSKPGAKVISFLKKYIPYQRCTSGTAVFGFVFLLHPETDTKALDFNTLPDDTSLRRSIKNHYLNGGRVYEDGGIFF